MKFGKEAVPEYHIWQGYKVEKGLPLYCNMDCCSSIVDLAHCKVLALQMIAVLNIFHD